MPLKNVRSARGDFFGIATPQQLTRGLKDVPQAADQRPARLSMLALQKDILNIGRVCGSWQKTQMHACSLMPRGSYEIEQLSRLRQTEDACMLAHARGSHEGERTHGALAES